MAAYAFDGTWNVRDLKDAILTVQRSQYGADASFRRDSVESNVHRFREFVGASDQDAVRWLIDVLKHSSPLCRRCASIEPKPQRVVLETSGVREGVGAARASPAYDAGGEAGIRTLGTGFSPYNGLAKPASLRTNGVNTQFPQ